MGQPPEMVQIAPSAFFLEHSARGQRALGWMRQQLTDRAMSLNAIIRLEQGVVDPRTSTIMGVRRALEAAGIEFLSLSDSDEG
jgi:predicted transcriptional regulator